MSFKETIINAISEALSTWDDAAGELPVVLDCVLPTEEELDEAFDAAQSIAKAKDIPAFRMLQVE